MKILFPLIAVLVLLFVAWLGAGVLHLGFVFGILVPYVAIVLFVGGFIHRVLQWAKVPVPFRIPTSCGQQHSLTWIKSSRLDNPHTGLGVIGRMALEVLAFRSLLRHTRTEVRPGGQVIHGSDIWLWIGSLAFHWCFLIIVIRHMRFFTDPVPGFVTGLAFLDGFLQIGAPVVLLSGLIMLLALTYIFMRRVVSPQLRYISLPADYLPLFLLLGIAATGLLLRHFVRADITAVKELAVGLVSFQPVVVEGVHWLFYGHLFLVSLLLAYFRFSKLMHMGGVFLSPTRNLANNNRMVRHINPWNPVVPAHPYDEYEDEFRDKMKAAGIPVEKD